mmetsp:Transcript_12806/g.22598  ORF Transcript_12806/g.22598 Transcript_12806/m.22598 type:complete len:83 (-) Transcript_12806:577-825(-)
MYCLTSLLSEGHMSVPIRFDCRQHGDAHIYQAGDEFTDPDYPALASMCGSSGGRTAGLWVRHTTGVEWWARGVWGPHMRGAQ